MLNYGVLERYVRIQIISQGYTIRQLWLSRMVKKLRLLKGGSVPTFVGLGPVLHNKLAVDV
jgi:hypothetical protein